MINQCVCVCNYVFLCVPLRHLLSARPHLHPASRCGCNFQQHGMFELNFNLQTFKGTLKFKQFIRCCWRCSPSLPSAVKALSLSHSLSASLPVSDWMIHEEIIRCSAGLSHSSSSSLSSASSSTPLFIFISGTSSRSHGDARTNYTSKTHVIILI